jgi:hypothetical protein
LSDAIGTTIAGEPTGIVVIGVIGDIALGPWRSARGAGAASGIAAGIGALFADAKSARGNGWLIGGAIIGAGIGLSAAGAPPTGATGGIGCMIGGGIVPPGRPSGGRGRTSAGGEAIGGISRGGSSSRAGSGSRGGSGTSRDGPGAGRGGAGRTGGGAGAGGTARSSLLLFVIGIADGGIGCASVGRGGRTSGTGGERSPGDAVVSDGLSFSADAASSTPTMKSPM